MTDRDDEALIPPTDDMAEIAVTLTAAATLMAQARLSQLVPGRRDAIRQSIVDDRASIAVQVNLPGGEITIVCDGNYWPRPQVLLALDPKRHGPTLETK